MQTLGIGWLCVILAERDGNPALAPLYIGLAGLARGVPAVTLGMFAGVIADRIDRRMLLLTSRVLATVAVGVLAGTTAAGATTLPFVIAIVFADSVANVFDLPTRAALLAQLVPVHALPTAVGVQNGTMMSAMLVGPLLAGALIVPFGLGGVLAANTVVYLVSLLVLFGLPSARPQPTEGRGTVLASLIDGLRYVRRDPVILWLVVISAAASVLTRPVQHLMPAFAHDVLGVGAVELSWLLAAMAGGAVLGTAAAAGVGSQRRRGVVLAAAVITWGISTIVLGVQTELVPTLLVAPVPGVAHWVVSGTVLLALQMRAADAYRGRVMGILFMAILGIAQFGTLILGYLGSALGVGTAMVLGGAGFALLGVYVLWRVPAVRNLGADRQAAGPGRSSTVVVTSPTA